MITRRRPPGSRSRLPPLLAALALAGFTVALQATELDAALAALERGDYSVAVPQLDTLAGRGDPVAIVKLAALYQQGRGVPRDVERAALLYEQAAARGNAEAQYNLGNMYLLGEGVPQDDDWAFTYYREAAKQGHAMAQKNVAEFYRAAGLTPPPDEVGAPAVEGEVPPTTPPQPLADAPVHPVVPAAGGAPPVDYTPDELNAIQMARQHGIDVRMDGSAVPPHLPSAPGSRTEPIASAAPTAPERPAAVGDPELTQAKELVAAGKLDAARPLLEAQANTGSAEAQFLLAQLLVTTSRGSADNAQALAWLKRAAAGGYANAQYLLGTRYERGEGVVTDEAEAVTWYRAAARQGHPQAASRLRAIYRDAGLPPPEELAPGTAPQGAATPTVPSGALFDDKSLVCIRHVSSQPAG